MKRGREKRLDIMEKEEGRGKGPREPRRHNANERQEEVRCMSARQKYYRGNKGEGRAEMGASGRGVGVDAGGLRNKGRKGQGENVGLGDIDGKAEWRDRHRRTTY